MIMEEERNVEVERKDEKKQGRENSTSSTSQVIGELVLVALGGCRTYV
jgi:hypothetical protein